MCVFSKDDICVDIVYRYRYVDIMLDVFVFIADPVSGTAPGPLGELRLEVLVLAERLQELIVQVSLHILGHLPQQEPVPVLRQQHEM